MHTKKAAHLALILIAFFVPSCIQKTPPPQPVADEKAPKAQAQPDTVAVAKPAEPRPLEQPPRPARARSRNEGVDEKLATLRAMVTELEIDKLGKQRQWEALENAKPGDPAVNAELQNLVSHDPAIIQLDKEARQRDDEYQALAARYGPNHRLVKESKTRRDTAADAASAERAKKILRYQIEQVETARRTFLEAEEQLLKLKEALFQAEQEQRARDRR